MEKEKYIIEVDLQKYIKEQNKLYNINLNLFDLSKDKDNKINLINKNIALKDTNKIKKEILLEENTEYKFLLKIISRGNIDKIEQVIFNTKDEYDTEKIKIVKKKIQISQNPMANWRKENERYWFLRRIQEVHIARQRRRYGSRYRSRRRVHGNHQFLRQ